MTTVYLIPCMLAEDVLETIPAYVLDAIKKCTVIFAENERTARRFLKSLDKNIVIDDYEWFAIHKAEEEQLINLKSRIKENKNIAIIFDALNDTQANAIRCVIHFRVDRGESNFEIGRARQEWEIGDGYYRLFAPRTRQPEGESR